MSKTNWYLEYKKNSHATQQITKAESRKYRLMNALETHSHGFRRARTRSLIQLGGLIDKSGLLETFGIVLGSDLQKDPAVKEPIAALFKGLLVLNEMAQQDDINIPLWTQQGLQEFRVRK